MSDEKMAHAVREEYRLAGTEETLLLVGRCNDGGEVVMQMSGPHGIVMVGFDGTEAAEVGAALLRSYARQQRDAVRDGVAPL